MTDKDKAVWEGYLDKITRPPAKPVEPYKPENTVEPLKVSLSHFMPLRVTLSISIARKQGKL